MRIVIAADSFGGSLTAAEAGRAIAEGWSEARAADTASVVAMSDGGEGLLDAVAGPNDTWHTTEVAGPLGHPRDASWLLQVDGTAVVEAARASGLALVPPERRDPTSTTTYGVGQLLRAAWATGATRVIIGLGGSATVDGGAGALQALGYRLRRDDGSGLKIGGGNLTSLSDVERGHPTPCEGGALELLADVRTTLSQAAAVYGPQKGATAEQVRLLTRGLETWANVLERDLGVAPARRQEPRSGAAGGLGYGLAAVCDVPLLAGVERVAQLVGLEQELVGADLVVTGEGRLDTTSSAGKVVGHVAERARAQGVPVVAVVGQRAVDAPDLLDDVEVARAAGPGPDPLADVRAAAARLARRTPRDAQPPDA